MVQRPPPVSLWWSGIPGLEGDLTDVEASSFAKVSFIDSLSSAAFDFLYDANPDALSRRSGSVAAR